MFSTTISFNSRNKKSLTSKAMQSTSKDQRFFNHTGSIANTTIYSLNQTMTSLRNSTISEIRWNTTLLTALNADMFSRLAPAVSFLVAVMAVGAVGNIIVCYIFCRKLRPSSQNCLLLSLGMFDLASCCLGIPSEIFDIRHYYMYESLVGCKTMRFLTTLPNLASVLVLLVIAADRYRKICKPLHHQIHRCHVKISLVIIVVLASLLSLPALFIYGHRILPTPVPGEFGYDCSISETHRSQQYHLMYEGLFFALFIVCTAALVLIYVKIWRETRRHLKYMKTHSMFGSVMLNDKYNVSSGNSDECVSDSRPNSINSIGVQRCYMCVRRKTGKKSVPRPKVDASKPVAIPMITLTSREIARIDDTVPECYLGPLQISSETADDASPSQVFELSVINKQADNISLACLPNCVVMKNGDRGETVDGEEKDDMYNVTDDRDTMIADTKQHNKAPESGLYFVQADDEYQNVDDRNPMISSSKQSEKNLQSCLYSLEDNSKIQDVSNQNSLVSDTIKRNKTPKSHLESYCKSQHEDDRDPKLSDNKHRTTSDNKHRTTSDNKHRTTSESCLNAMETDYDNNVAKVTAESSVNDESPVCNQSTSALIAKVTRPKNSKFCHEFSKLKSFHLNSSSTHKNMPADQHRLSEPLKQTSTGDSGYNKSYIKNDDNQTSQQTEETTPTEYICRTHTCDNLPEKTQCLNHSLNTKLSNASRQSSYSSQSTICSDNESVELDYFQSKRVSFSRDLDDCEYSPPVAEALELPESNCLNKLHRSRSDQSLLFARRSKKALRSTRTTILAFAITLGFIISYLPYLILALLRSVIANFGQQFDGVSLNVYNIFLRSYFANNVINIFVYSFMHLEFRTQLSHLCKKLTLSTPTNQNSQTSKKY